MRTGRVLKVGFRVFGVGTGIDVLGSMIDFARQWAPKADFHRVDVTRAAGLDIGAFDRATLFRFLLSVSSCFAGM